MFIHDKNVARCMGMFSKSLLFARNLLGASQPAADLSLSCRHNSPTAGNDPRSCRADEAIAPIPFSSFAVIHDGTVLKRDQDFGLIGIAIQRDRNQAGSTQPDPWQERLDPQQQQGS